jgi:hypothetical protein
MRRAAPLVLAAVLISGCGSGDASPLALRRHATAVCKASTPVTAPSGAEPSPGQLASFLSQGTANLQRELVQLQRLRGFTGEVGAIYSAALRALAAQVQALHRAITSIRRGQDPALAFTALQQTLGPLQKQADNAWSALQIPACLEPET